MATFRYTARGEDGKVVKGTIDSASKESALDALQQLRMAPMEVEPLVSVQYAQAPAAPAEVSAQPPVASPPPQPAAPATAKQPPQRALPVRSARPAPRPVSISIKKIPSSSALPQPVTVRATPPPAAPVTSAPAQAVTIAQSPAPSPSAPATPASPAKTEVKAPAALQPPKKKRHWNILSLFRKKTYTAAPIPPPAKIASTPEKQEKKSRFFAPKQDAAAAASGAETATPKRYLPLLSTLRHYAGWIFAWFACVVALGYYVHVRALSFEIPLVYGLYQSPLVESFLTATFFFLLFSSLHRALHGGVLKGLALTAIGFASFAGVQMVIV